jgi:hypothetical protein
VLKFAVALQANAQKQRDAKRALAADNSAYEARLAGVRVLHSVRRVFVSITRTCRVAARNGERSRERGGAASRC